MNYTKAHKAEPREMVVSGAKEAVKAKFYKSKFELDFVETIVDMVYAA